MALSTIDLDEKRAEFRSLIDRFTPKGKAADLAAPATAAPTYSQRILKDIPAKLAEARARGLAGDTRSGKAILDGVTAWIDEHSETLQEISGYRGSDKFGRRVSDAALDLLSRKGITELLPQMDPEANPRSVEFDAAERGWGTKTTEIARKARYDKDPEAIALLSFASAGGPSHAAAGGPSRAAAGGPGETPGGFDEAFLSYYGTAKSRLTGGMPNEVSEQFSPEELVGLLGSSYRTGDRTFGTALVGNVVAAVNEAKDLDPLARANLARSMFNAQDMAMKAWGGEDDARWRSSGAAVIGELRKALPRDTFVAQKDVVSRIMKTTAETAGLWAADGRPMSADKMAQFARIRLYNETRPSDPMSPGDRAADSVISDAVAMQNRLIVSPAISVPAEGKAGQPQEDLQAKYSFLQGVLKSAIGSAGADAFVNDRTVKDTLPERRDEIARGLLRSVPGLTEAEASNFSGVLIPMMLNGKEIDLRKLPDLIAQTPILRKAASEDAEKGLEAGTPEIIQSASKTAAGFLAAKEAGIDQRLYEAVLGAENTSRIPFTSGSRLVKETGRALADAVDAAQTAAYEIIAQEPASTVASPDAKKRLSDAFLSGMKSRGLKALLGAIPESSLAGAADFFASNALEVLNPAGRPRFTESEASGRTVGELLGDATMLKREHGEKVREGRAFAASSAFVGAVAPGGVTSGPSEMELLQKGLLEDETGNVRSLPSLRARILSAAGSAAAAESAAQPPVSGGQEVSEPPREVAVDPLLLAGVDVALAQAGLDKVKAWADRPVKDAATAYLLNRSIPETLDQMIRTRALTPVDGREFLAAAVDAADAGVGYREIASTFNKNVSEVSRSRAAEQARAENKAWEARYRKGLEIKQEIGGIGLAGGEDQQ